MPRNREEVRSEEHVRLELSIRSMVRDKEKMLAVKQLMLESVLNLRFREATPKYEEHLIAWESIIIDKASTAPTIRQKKVNTSAPMEIGMAAKDDSEGSREEGHQ